ncbi:MAG: glycosyltransferase family 9 protein [Phycisphaerales bacterium]|nr:glycosyltransferase family 9 protein [Phycisphaerales bacterium]
MDIGTQRFIDRWVGTPACAALSALHAVTPVFGSPSPAEPPQRILIILLSEMGSLVLAEPMLRTLRSRYPRAELHFLLFARNRQLLDLLGVVDQDKVIEIRDTSAWELLGGLLGAIRRIRGLRIDTVIDCELFARVSAIVSGLSGAARRVGFHRHTQEGLYRGSFMTSRVLYNPYRHLSHQLLSLADAIESRSTPPAKETREDRPLLPPPFSPEEGEVERERAALHAAHTTLAQGPLVFMYPSGGLLPIRAWPLDHYAAVARALLSDGCSIAIIGMDSDHALGEQLRARVGGHARCVNLSGYTRSVRHLMSLFQCGALVITNDGGPVQFAAMAGIQSIVFFGPETPTLYRSWSPLAHVYFTQLPCAPCVTAYNHRTSPCDGDNQCLKRILPDEVAAKAREMLARHRARPTAVATA